MNDLVPFYPTRVAGTDTAVHTRRQAEAGGSPVGRFASEESSNAYIHRLE
jgi:hypothetical protein